MDKVKYRCKGCGWSKVLPSDWADISPRFCPTPTCEMSVKKGKGKKSFKLTPDMLEITTISAPTPASESKPAERVETRYERQKRLNAAAQRSPEQRESSVSSTEERGVDQ